MNSNTLLLGHEGPGCDVAIMVKVGHHNAEGWVSFRQHLLHLLVVWVQGASDGPVVEEVLWGSASSGDFHINSIPGDMEGQCCHIGPESHLKKDYSDSG